MILLDTNIWITLLKGRSPLMEEKWRSVAAADIVVCSVEKAELWHGAHKYEDPGQRRAIVDHWLGPYLSLPFDDTAAHHYATLRHHLEQRGEIIGPNDLKIAAICLAHDLTLVTKNTAEFSRILALMLEDWSVPVPARP